MTLVNKILPFLVTIIRTVVLHCIKPDTQYRQNLTSKKWFQIRAG